MRKRKLLKKFLGIICAVTGVIVIIEVIPLTVWYVLLVVLCVTSVIFLLS
ncbi:MAG: hypothetical protein WC996_00895 [Peptostreptococcales bacterium]